MKKVTETAKELGITFCQDCALYSWEFCNKFKFSTDPGDLSCPHFIPMTNQDKFKREIKNVASGCGYGPLNVTFIEKKE